LPAFLGFAALSVDLGVIELAKGQLQTVSDASAIAGARQLGIQQWLTVTAVQRAEFSVAQSAAQSKAVQIALKNKVLGNGAILLPNSTNSNTGVEDVVVGYLSRPFDPNQLLRTDPSDLSIPYFNTVQIRASRSASHGGQVPGFFSLIWGHKGSDVKTGATAAALGISGFRKIDGFTRANCLPIVLDIATFKAMVLGQTTDQYTYDAATNTVTAEPDGVTESKLYPVSNGYPGNWGTIKIGVFDNSTSTLEDQIRYGITPDQLANFPTPDPTTGNIPFGGNPGISAGLKDALASIIGKPVRIPIYDPSLTGGNGNNLEYQVIAFAPVRIMKVVFRGKSKYVIVQPIVQPEQPEPDKTEVWGGLMPMTNQFHLALIR
jgi:hypothetical protein